ncbi:MAG: glycosyltransferase family 4 protein [Nitrososphaerota archaeon]|nr:glycosyltransferase family 4 protein [Nitrososphaerota archaeon]
METTCPHVPKYEMKILRPKVIMIHVNDIIRPKTGGQYVYQVIYNELKMRGYEIINLSTPLLVNAMCRYLDDASVYLKNLAMGLAEVPARSLCFISSMLRLKDYRHILITSASPSFPVFGDITYHQPPVGIGFWPELIRPSARSLMLKYLDMISRPVWNFSKRTMVHLSNSAFTADLVKKKYGVSSVVLYPPVPVRSLLDINLDCRRKRWVLLTRLVYEGGALLLPAIARRLSKDVKLIIIGRIDRIGLQVLQQLKKLKANFNYLGFVDEKMKRELLAKCACFLHLGINEPFGISVVEAMASGCLPIAHRSGAIPEYLPDKFMYVYPEEAFQKISQIVENPHLPELREARRELREKALCFNEDIFRGKFMKVFNFVARAKLEKLHE